MKITAIKTEKVTGVEQNIFDLLEKSLAKFRGKNRIIVAVTSKVVSICEGRVVKVEDADEEDIIKGEAEYFLPMKISRYDIMLTLKNNIMIPNAGIDESNGNGYYILWPKNPQKTANDIRKHLQASLKIKNLGVIITDSKTTPLRWGTTGVALVYSGFIALRSYIGKEDIFGRKLNMTKANIADALAVSAVLMMGEGSEQTPVAVIEDVPFVKFQKSDPSKAELKDLKISIKDDLYAPLLTSVKWQKGGKKWL
jgi:dihydrofolate synthase / folylpolyglutamate synthase